MSEIGVFTPEQARLLWQDYLSRQQLPARLNRHFPQRQPVYDVSPHRIFVHNTTAEEVPAFGCMRITGVETIGGITTLKIEKPSSTDGEFVFNGPYPIAADSTDEETEITTYGIGWGYRHGTVLMLGDAPAEVGERYLPIVNSWEIEAGNGPFVVFGRDVTNDRTLTGRIQAAGGGGGEIAHFTIVEVDCDGEGNWSCEVIYYSGGCDKPIPDADPYTGYIVVHPFCGGPFSQEELEASGSGVAVYTYDLDTCEGKWVEITHCAEQGC